MGADAPSRVYLAADDFQGHAVGSCPDGWGTCGPTWFVDGTGDRRHLASTSANSYLLAGDPNWTDVVVDAKVAAVDPAGCPGIASRAANAANLVYAGYYYTNPSMPDQNIAVWPRVANGDTLLFHGDAVIAPSEWHTVRVAWTQNTVRLYHDNNFVGMGAVTTTALAAGRAGLFSTYSGRLSADDVIVRTFVDPEPTVDVGPPQQCATGCPW